MSLFNLFRGGTDELAELRSKNYQLREKNDELERELELAEERVVFERGLSNVIAIIERKERALIMNDGSSATFMEIALHYQDIKRVVQVDVTNCKTQEQKDIVITEAIRKERIRLVEDSRGILQNEADELRKKANELLEEAKKLEMSF